jgi:hypothetical protein
MQRMMLGVLALCGTLGGCTVLPELEKATGGVPVRDIVLRVKCELSDAFLTDDGRWLIDTDRGKFRWLKYWTAQIDLSLQVVNSTTFAPGGSFNAQLHNDYAFGAGPSSVSTSGVPGTTIAAIPQSYAIAVGASLGGQAQRTETISFALALQELMAWRTNPVTGKICDLPDGAGLRGSLGLKPWIAEALSPVAREGEPELPEYLWAGIHPKPTTTSPTPQKGTDVPPAPKTTSMTTDLKSLSEVKPCTIEDLQAKISKVNLDPNFKQFMTTATSAMTSAAAADNNAQSAISSSQKTIRDLGQAIADYKKKNGVLIPVIDRSIRREVNAVAGALAKFYGGSLDLQSAVQAAADKVHKALERVDQLSKSVQTINDKTNAATDVYNAYLKKPDDASLQAACRQMDDTLKLLAEAPANARNAQFYAELASKNEGVVTSNQRQLTDYAKVATDYISKLPTIDPPMGTIGQSVQFVLNYGGNFSPTWTLVAFHGPTGPLLSGTRTRTHMLNISLGPAAPGSFNTPSAAVTQNQQNLLFNNLLGPH